MTLDLSLDEARLLRTQLQRRIAELDGELVRTDKHELQHALALDIEKLRAVAARLEKLTGG
jgi:hypothetical protein